MNDSLDPGELCNIGAAVNNLRSAILFAVMLLASTAAAATATDDPLTFVLIQPGAPGSTEEAAPLMARWADYLSAHLNGHPPITGLYVNTIERARNVLSQIKPRFVVVTLPYYLEQRRIRNFQPQLISRPGGHTEDHYRLLVTTTNPVSTWQALKGEVAGTLCHTMGAVARLMFDQPAAKLPFRCQPTDRLLRAARQVVRGELDGLLVTDEQYTSLMTLPEGKSLRELYATGPLPPPLVVTLGRPDGVQHAIIQILLGMKDDPTARELLTELRTDGFGPVDLNGPNGLTPLQDAFERAGKP
jgi:hypothetical protein